MTVETWSSKSGKYQAFIIKAERSDTIILGILAHFRHFPGLSGLGDINEYRK